MNVFKVKAFAGVLGFVFAFYAPAYAAEQSTLLNTIDAALAYSPELKARQENHQVSEYAVSRAQAGKLPTLNLYGGVGLGRLKDNTTKTYGEDSSFRSMGDFGVRASQPIFHGFSPTHDIEGRKANLEAAGKGLEDRASSIVFEAIVAHTEVTRRRELVRLALNNVKQHSDIYSTINRRYKAGVATTGELNQIKGRVARATATLHSYESSLDAALANYQYVTGKKPGQLQPTAMPKRSFSSTDEIRELALKNNPRLQSLLADVRAAQSEKGQAQGRFYPQVDLVLGSNWSDRKSDADVEVSEQRGEVRVNWELFSGGSDVATVKMAGARIRQARHNLHSMMNSLNEDIESTFSRYQAAGKEIQNYQIAKQAGRAARKDYYSQFLSAQRSLLDVLDAENDYFFAASQEAISSGDRALAAYRLLVLSGELLPALHIEPDSLKTNNPTADETLPDMQKDFDSPLSAAWRNK